jgi:hypothetical protein
MTAVWDRSKHKGSELLILLAIADHVGDENGLAWPSIGHLAKKSRMSAVNTQRCVRALIGSGELIQVRQGEGRKSSVYRLNLETYQVDTPIAGDRAAPSPVRAESSGNRKEPEPPKPPKGELLFPLWKKRLGAIFNRKESTAWSEKELKAFDAIVPIDDFELQLVEKYYRAERIKGEKNRSRRDLITMLNNWNGEVDRAKVWANRRDFKRGRGPTPAKEGPATQEDFTRIGGLAKAELERLRENLRNPNRTDYSARSPLPPP